jgi:hypothetical protein
MLREDFPELGNRLLPEQLIFTGRIGAIAGSV